LVKEDTEEEKAFRGRYAAELRKKKQDSTDSELEVERKKVSEQGMKTPGRRGEQIKHEEIDKEIVRRYTARQENEKDDEDKKRKRTTDNS
jgi:hypothetical protein